MFVSKKCVGMSGLTSGASPARRHEVHAFLARRSVTSSVVDAPFGRTTVKSAHGRFQNPGTKSRLVNTPTTLFNVSTTGRCRSPEALRGWERKGSVLGMGVLYKQTVHF